MLWSVSNTRSRTGFTYESTSPMNRMTSENINNPKTLSANWDHRSNLTTENFNSAYFQFTTDILIEVHNGFLAYTGERFAPAPMHRYDATSLCKGFGRNLTECAHKLINLYRAYKCAVVWSLDLNWHKLVSCISTSIFFTEHISKHPNRQL